MTEGVPLTDVPGDDAIVDAAVDALESTRYVKGPRVERFEAAFADVCDVDHAVAVGSGTDALLLAMRANGVGPDDSVIGTNSRSTTSPASTDSAITCMVVP
jgi:dTDP-4-amino-4,6-dideoxygalactose transaminase